MASDFAQQGKPVRPEFFIQSAEFIRGFTDGCHHRKEENVLFKALNATGVPAQAMRQGAEKWKAGDETGKGEALQAAAGYVNLLHQHIFKENNILFPMADLIIPFEKQGQVAEDFERVEHEETGEGIHEKYLGLAQALEAEASTWK